MQTILVVEDRGDDYLLFQRMLKKSKIFNPTQLVETVEDALSYLKGEGEYKDREKYPFPILMLLDVHLPDGTAYDILKWISTHPQKAPAAVVVLTGSDVHAIRRSYAAGASSFLTKPLRFEDFENMTKAVRGIKLRKAEQGYILEPESEFPV